MNKEEFNPEVLTDSEVEELARLISEGYTSGIIDSDNTRVSWSLSFNKFEN